MGRRYAFALLCVFGMVIFFALIAVSLRFYVNRQMRHAFAELETVLPQLREKTESGHDMKTNAGGRQRPRLAQVKGGVSGMPEIVDVTKEDIRFGVEEDAVEGENALADISETFEALDSAYEAGREDLPFEGPHLQPTEVVEQMPQFPGGITALMKWLDEHVVYPQSCIRMRIVGELQVSFFVEVDGTIHEPKIVYSLHPDLDRAVLNAVRRMPRWQPGKIDGKLSVVCVTLPVNFQPR